MNHIKTMLEKYGISIMFTFLLFLFAFMGIFISDKTNSDTENRPLQQKPKLSTTSLMSGNYQSQMESYMSDQFPLRFTWVQIRTNLEQEMGKKEFNGVFIGKDNELFQERIVPSQEMMNEKIKTVNTFAEKYSNMRISMLLAPNKTTVLKDKLALRSGEQDQHNIIKTFQMGLIDTITFVNPTSILKKHKDETMYYRSDHHWTSKGAYYAFEEWKKAMLPDEKLLTYECNTVNNSFYGTMANTSGYYRGSGDRVDIYTSKDDPKYYVQYVNRKKSATSLFDRKKAKSNNPYEVFLSGNESLINIVTTTDNDRHLLIIKDSYANCFIPYLLSYYHDITIVDPRYYYDDLNQLIKDKNITDTLFLYNANTFFADRALQSLVLSE